MKIIVTQTRVIPDGCYSLVPGSGMKCKNCPFYDIELCLSTFEQAFGAPCTEIEFKSYKGHWIERKETKVNK